MTSKILASILLLSLTIISGCGGFQSPAVVSAAAPVDPNSVFCGKYLFHSRGVGSMFESGVIAADCHGHFTLHSMYISDSQNNSINTAGHYTLNSSFAGTANQGQCAMSTPVCVPGDNEALFVSSDGNHAMMVSMEGPGAGWSLEMDKDPGIIVADLSNCDASSGVITGCNDGWIFPKIWK